MGEKPETFFFFFKSTAEFGQNYSTQEHSLREASAPKGTNTKNSMNATSS